MRSCYLHIPFCDSICYYCDFCRIQLNQEIKKHWLEKINEEINGHDISNLDTLYFGGGTPSLLTVDEFKQIALNFKDVKEWTIECNPESLDEEKIKVYKACGINRISLGVQTFNDPLLKSINRKHTKQDILNVINLLKKYNMTNISIDLIYGLPNQTIEDVARDIEIFLSLNLKHLSIYSLQIEENSVFGKNRIEPCDEELEADMYEMICKKLTMAGYHHYEISSFCKEGYHSLHNLAYWQDEDFIGIGCGASGRETGIRYDNTKSIQKYIKHGSCPKFIEQSNQERAFDAIMMALRTTFGLDIDKWNKRYGMDFMSLYRTVLERYQDYLKVDQGRLKPTQKGMEILNTILVDFLMID